MAIMTRVKRLLAADVHAVLDSMEEPHVVLKQAIREMQESLDMKHARLNGEERSLAALRSRQTLLGGDMEAVRNDLALALEGDSEELARKTVARKIATEKRLAAVRRRIEDATRTSGKLQAEIDLQQNQLESILEKARLFAPVSDDDSAFSVAESILAEGFDSRSEEPSGFKSGFVGVSSEEIELELMRLRQKREGGAS